MQYLNKFLRLIEEREEREELKKSFEDSEVFIFAKSDEIQEIDNDITFFTPPFKNCYLEMDNGPITSDEEGLNVDVQAFQISEKSPNVYRITAMVSGTILPLPHFKIEWIGKECRFSVDANMKDKSVRDATHSMFLLCATLLHRLHTDKIGSTHTPFREKLKSSRGKLFYTFPRVTYVYGKNKRIDTNKRFSDNKIITWSHRWLVRGHWRKIPDDKLGLDRSGQRIVEGFTWIKSHEKGQGVLIRKERKVQV